MKYFLAALCAGMLSSIVNANEVQDLATALEREGYEARDFDNRKLTIAGLVEAGKREFQLLSAKTIYRIQHRTDSVEGMTMTMVVSDRETAKVLSRRKFRIDPNGKSTEEAKVRFYQTIRSMEVDLGKGREPFGVTTIALFSAALGVGEE